MKNFDKTIFVPKDENESRFERGEDKNRYAFSLPLEVKKMLGFESREDVNKWYRLRIFWLSDNFVKLNDEFNVLSEKDLEYVKKISSQGTNVDLMNESENIFRIELIAEKILQTCELSEISEGGG